MLEKIKPFYTILLLIVIGSIFFALGRLSTAERDKTSIQIEYPNVSQTSAVVSSVSTSSVKKVPTKAETVAATQVKKPATTTVVMVAPLVTSSAVVGSKSGKKYYFPWCGTVKRIKPENQVHFGSIEEARTAGFTPGGNCKGLK